MLLQQRLADRHRGLGPFRRRDHDELRLRDASPHTYRPGHVGGLALAGVHAPCSVNRQPSRAAAANAGAGRWRRRAPGATSALRRPEHHPLEPAARPSSRATGVSRTGMPSASRRRASSATARPGRRCTAPSPRSRQSSSSASPAAGRRGRRSRSAGRATPRRRSRGSGARWTVQRSASPSIGGDVVHHAGGQQELARCERSEPSAPRTSKPSPSRRASHHLEAGGARPSRTAGAPREPAGAGRPATSRRG